MHDPVMHCPRRRGVVSGGLVASAAAAVALIGAQVPSSAAPVASVAAPSPAGITPGPCAGITVGVRALCGRLTVPLNRADPGAGTTQIAFALIKHRDTALPSQGTVFYNPGGPGLTTVAQADSLVTMFGPLLDRRDLLLMDLRGSGASDPLSCPSLSAALAFSPQSVRAAAIGACGRSLGSQAAGYDTAEIAADLDALRAALGIGSLDLWGESWGSYLAQTYAARFPGHVRSLVLSGPVPLDFQPWGVAEAAASRTAFGLVCARDGGACQESEIAAQLLRLGAQLGRHPVDFTARLGSQQYPAVLDQRTLASVVYGAGSAPEFYGRIPAAVASALAGDDAALEQLAVDAAAPSAYILSGSPPAAALFGRPLESAIVCHDYPRAFSYAAAPAVRAAQYRAGLAAQNPAAFFPFSAAAWNESGADLTLDCLDWPSGPTAGAPAPGPRMPAVPVLVMAGDLDAATPIAFGRVVAAEFARATLVPIPNVGHVPTQGSACALDLGLTFVAHLTTGGRSCAGTGTPPPLAAPAAFSGADVVPVAGSGTLAQRRAVGLVVAMSADLTHQSQIVQLFGAAEALRGGSYSAQADGSITLDAVKVVRDATLAGSVTPDGAGGGGGTMTLSGPGVLSGTLQVRLTAQGHGQAVGTLGGVHVDLAF